MRLQSCEEVQVLRSIVRGNNAGQRWELCCYDGAHVTYAHELE